MSNVYLDNNRIMKMKDVDRELSKIGTWRENEKEIIIGVLAVLLSCAIFYGSIKKIQKNNITIEAKKTSQTKSLANDNTYFYLEKQGIQR